MEEVAAVTSAIDHYDGIFKFIHSEAGKSSFLLARKRLSENRIVDAEDNFRKSLDQCDSDIDKNTIRLILTELKRYKDHTTIPSDSKTINNIDWSDVYKRRVEKFEEPHDVLPQGVFLLNLKLKDNCKLSILSRKNLSELWISDLIPEIFCSQVREDMLLGVLSDWRFTDDKVVAYFHPFNFSEKRQVFHETISSLETDPTDIDLVFPFPLLPSRTRKELTSPAEGWDVDETYDVNLSHGEEHIRQVTVDILRKMKFTSHRLYDPACSTGVFLHSLKEAFPDCVTIGQDLSQKMCDVAKARVDQVHCGNAMTPLIDTGSADCVFVRFLNSEVVTTGEARQLLTALLSTVAVNGIMIVFGHTPVLLSSDDFRLLDGFKLVRNVAASKDKRSIFQYYILQRCSV